MEIEKRGIPPNEKKYKTVCRKCDSVLIVIKNDTVSVRGFGKLIFVCPVCYVRFLLDGVYL